METSCVPSRVCCSPFYRKLEYVSHVFKMNLDPDVIQYLFIKNLWDCERIGIRILRLELGRDRNSGGDSIGIGIGMVLRTGLLLGLDNLDP